MGRKRRLWDPRYFDHVVMRGNNRQDIFKTEADVREFIRVLHYVYMKYPFQIIAYCIMTNHYHLLIKSPDVPLGKVMGLINRRYSDYYKKKYNYSGYLYDRRYFAAQVNNPEALLKVSRYIHRNPIETVVPMVSKMEDYSHSSFHFYEGDKPSPYEFLELSILPAILTSSYMNHDSKYCRYCEEELDGTRDISITDYLEKEDLITK